VERDKLDRLRARGDSVVEIDLSRVDRGLSGDELCDMILREAPRSWLFHRDARRRARQVASKVNAEARKKEARREAAIGYARQREEARLAALDRPPSIEDRCLLAWASRQRRRWEMVGMGSLFESDIPGPDMGDGLFDVPADVWRAQVAFAFAPWSKSPLAVGWRTSVGEVAGPLGQDLRSCGWVKGPFAGPLTRFVRRTIEWDPVKETIEEMLSISLGDAGYRNRMHTAEVSLGSAIKDMSDAWREIVADIASLVSIGGSLRERGVKLMLRGIEVDTAEGVMETLCGDRAGSKEEGRAFSSPASVLGSIADALKGRERPGSHLSPEDALTRQGVTLRYTTSDGKGVAPDDGGEDVRSSTGDSLAHLRNLARVSQQADVNTYARSHACDLLSVFLGLVGRSEALRAQLKDRDPDLLQVDGVFEQLVEPIDPTQGDPVAAASRAIDTSVRRLCSLASDLTRVLDLAEAMPDDRTGEYCLHAGCAAVLNEGSGRLWIWSSEGRTRDALSWIAEIRSYTQRWGYGEDFPERALMSVPPGESDILLALILGGEVVAARKALAGIRSRREPPSWVTIGETVMRK
jgi:hypothetical protein